mgnify:CR=1 FL=1
MMPTFGWEKIQVRYSSAILISFSTHTSCVYLNSFHCFHSQLILLFLPFFLSAAFSISFVLWFLKLAYPVNCFTVSVLNRDVLYSLSEG